MYSGPIPLLRWQHTPQGQATNPQSLGRALLGTPEQSTHLTSQSLRNSPHSLRSRTWWMSHPLWSPTCSSSLVEQESPQWRCDSWRSVQIWSHKLASIPNTINMIFVIHQLLESQRTSERYHLHTTSPYDVLWEAGWRKPLPSAPKKYWKDFLKKSMMSCNIPPGDLKILAADHTACRWTVIEGSVILSKREQESARNNKQ